MKRMIRSSEDVFGMANLNPIKSGLKAHIWSDNQGVTRNKPDHLPIVKISEGDDCISVSIESDASVLAPKNWTKKFTKSVVSDFEEAIKYVERNFDLFLKHYNDIDGSFDDESLFAELRSRGEYK